MERRDRATLTQILYRVLLPGLEVHSDDWAAYRNLHVHVPNVTVHRTVVHRDNFYNYINTEHMEIKKIIVIFSITLLCTSKVMHNVNSLLKMILSKQILDQDVSTAPGDADHAPSEPGPSGESECNE